MTTRPKVVVTRRLPEAVENGNRGTSTHLNAEDRPLGAEGLQRALQSAGRLLCTVTDRLTDEVLGVEPRRARLLANFGVGFNHIDVDSAKRHGLAVSNTPDVLTDATADIAMTLLLTVTPSRGKGRQLRGGAWTGWRPTHLLGTQVSGKTLGLVGMGRIARAVAKRAHHGFDMKVIFHDPYPPPPDVARSLGAEPRERLEQVLEEADFVSLHCPATPETRHLMNADRLGRMKPGAYLINTARGDVVDEAALVAALGRARWRVPGSTFEREPAGLPELLAMENVVLLPHLGSATRETRVAMGMRALENLRLFFQGQALRDKVV